ncbi:MAG: hypothetical protein WC444_01535 [Candidatus Paceibacterota bacterium]
MITTDPTILDQVLKILELKCQQDFQGKHLEIHEGNDCFTYTIDHTHFMEGLEGRNGREGPSLYLYLSCSDDGPVIRIDKKYGVVFRMKPREAYDSVCVFFGTRPHRLSHVGGRLCNPPA